MTWEYRVVVYDDAEAGVAIHEITYDAKGRITGWSGAENGPPGLQGFNVEDLSGILSQMKLAFDKPPLKVRDIVAAVKEAAANRFECADCNATFSDDCVCHW